MKQTVLLSMPVEDLRLLISDVVNDCFYMHLNTAETKKTNPPDNKLTKDRSIKRKVIYFYSTLLNNNKLLIPYSSIQTTFNEMIKQQKKANNHWKTIEGGSLAVFNGPHAYVSEKWYEVPNVVPTWNYVVVHVSGKIKITNEQELKQIIEMMIKNHEGDFQIFKNNIDDKLYSTLMTQIVGLKMEIENYDEVILPRIQFVE